MDLIKQFADNIRQHQLFNSKDKLLLAVSGGVDSVVLCELCHQLKYEFKIAHCNFQLRGKESERDENFVKSLGEKYGVAVISKKFATKQIASAQKISIQEAARNLRYEWFSNLLIELHPKQFNLLLTAHHRDDDIETVLMNFFKGTGIAGLRGILPKNGNIIRPLLFASKEIILSFACEQNLEWVEDSSNAEIHYSRNKFRLEIIPKLKEIFPAVEENLANTIQRFKDIEIIYKQAIEIHKKKLIEKINEEVHIPILKLKQSEPQTTIIYELIKEFGFVSKQVDEVKKLFDSESGKFIQSATHRVIKNRNWLIITTLNSNNAETIVIEEKTSETAFLNGKLKFEEIENSDKLKIPKSALETLLDADLVSYPLLLRKPKQADYFYPLGMKKKKKIARFFIDKKLSKTEKEKIWVLESNKKICWILGLRIDDRFKITGNTKTILKLSLEVG